VHAERSYELKRSRARAVVTVERVPSRQTWDELWDLYYDAFSPLQELALLNHLYPRPSFEELLADERVTKLIAWVDGRPVGLAMLTNELELVPQISPPFLHARYPDESERGAVFFGIMVLVSDSRRRGAVFARLIAGMAQITAEASGVVVFDICRHNMEAMELDRQIGSFTRWFPGSTFDQVDEQRYFAAKIPARANAGLPVSPDADLDEIPRLATRRLTQVSRN
jgi:hypothetical protein